MWHVQHNHSHCAHVLDHCAQCDVAYCTACFAEWRKQPVYWTTTTPAWDTWTITADNGTASAPNATVTVASHDH